MSFDYLTAIAGGTSLLIVMLVAAGWLWIYWKTGSSHAPTMRIWRVLTGNREIADQGIRSYIEEQDGLMAFRLGSGMRVRSAAHAHRAIVFIAEHDLSPDHLRQVGAYFDANELKMAPLPSAWYRTWLFISAAILAALFLIAGLAAFEQRALVRLKKTGSWFWLSQTSAQAASFPFRDGSRVWFSACTSSAVQPSYPFSERETLCAVRRDPAFGNYFGDTLRSQRIALVFLMVISFFVAVWQWKDFLRAIAAIRFDSELSEKLRASSKKRAGRSRP